MEVTKELKGSLGKAISVALDEGTKGNDILDEVVIEAVIGVLLGHKVEVVDMAGKKRVPVQYIGKRRTYTDGLFDTGLWNYGDVKLVSISTATKMLEHADVYIPGEEEESVDVVDIDDKKVADDQESERIEQTRNLVAKMTRKAAVVSFVAENYNGLQIPAEFTKLDDMKAFATQQIDRYGII